MAAAFQYVTLAKDGVGLPVVGGLLDQTESFMAAWQVIDSEEAFWQKANDGGK